MTNDTPRAWVKAHPRDWPDDRALLGWSRIVPFGYRLGEGTVHVVQRGTGTTPGLWMSSPQGARFLPDLPVAGHPDHGIASDVFTHYAEVPAFDGED